eukprot:7385952-Prymnesium_polylepis.1
MGRPQPPWTTASYLWCAHRAAYPPAAAPCPAARDRRRVGGRRRRCDRVLPHRRRAPLRAVGRDGPVPRDGVGRPAARLGAVEAAAGGAQRRHLRLARLPGAHALVLAGHDLQGSLREDGPRPQHLVHAAGEAAPAHAPPPPRSHSRAA